MTALTSRRRQTLSIRYTLPLLIVAPIAITVTLILTFAFYNGRRAARELGLNLSAKTLASIEQHVESYLEKPSLLNRAHAATVRSGLLDLEDTEAIVNYFWEQSRLSAEADLDSLSFGRTNGDFVLIQRLPDETGELRLRTAETAPNREFYRLNALGERVELSRVQEYDPRDRPWYQAGVEAGEPVWSSIFQAADAATLNISSIVPIYDAGNRLQGVLAATIELAALNDFLGGLSISPNGEAFIVEASGEIVASSTSEPVVVTAANGDRQRLFATDSSDPAIAAAAQQLFSRFDSLSQIEDADSFIYQESGQRQIISMVPLAPELGLDWLVVAILPSQDFSSAINANLRATALIGIVIGVAAIVLGLAAARWLVRPIEQLGRAARDIKTDRFQTYTLREVVARRDELGELGRTIQDMGIVIGDRQQNFADQVRELRQQSSSVESKSTRDIELAYYQALQNKAQWLRKQPPVERPANGRSDA